MSKMSNAVKHSACRKRGMLSFCKCLFEWIGANLARIQAANLQSVQNAFLAKSSRS